MGGRKFGNVTRDHVGELLAIVLDGVISAPRIDEPILGGSGIIRGSFTVQEANELAVLLRAGALPAPLEIVEERTVGPDLGADSIEAGKWASIIGLILVALAMALYYGLFGVFANLALLVNLVLIIAALSLLGHPDAAGHRRHRADHGHGRRQRPDLRAHSRGGAVGRPPMSAIDAGYREAMRTIIDANLTTLIAAVLLYAFGSGPVRGFAVTLGIGIITSMFTAITFTRLLMATWPWRTRLAMLPV